MAWPEVKPNFAAPGKGCRGGKLQQHQQQVGICTNQSRCDAKLLECKCSQVQGQSFKMEYFCRRRKLLHPGDSQTRLVDGVRAALPQLLPHGKLCGCCPAPI